MSKSNSSKITAKNLTAAAICLTLCMILPIFTGQIPHIGMALAPMHIPVLLCGFITGPAYAMIVGFAAPLLRMMTFGMPPPFMAITMCFELAAYGAISGLLYNAFKKKIIFIYLSLVIAMLFGRIVWGLAAWQLIKTPFFPTLPPGITAGFGWSEFFTAAFVSAIPGIILHIILIPVLVMALRKARVVSY